MAYNGIHYRTPGAGSQSTPVANLTDLRDDSTDLVYILGVKYSGNDPTPVLVNSINPSPVPGADLPLTNIATIADLENKQDTLTTGSHITINDNTISANYSDSDFDISQLADQGGLRTTWSGKQDPISVSAPLTKTGNTISVDLSSKSISLVKMPNSSTAETAVDCQKLMQGDTEIGYLPLSTSAGLTYAKEYYATSDKSMKENVSEVTPDNNIFNVPIVEFNWKDTKAKSVGVIAQDLEKVAPIAVSTSDSGMKSVNYTTFLLLRIAALEKELKEIKEKLS